jgi:hypothetical protein
MADVTVMDGNRVGDRAAKHGRYALGPLSPRHRLRKLDGRTKEAQLIRRVERDLYKHLGTSKERCPATKRILIERVAVDCLRLALHDQRILAGEPVSDLDLRIAGALRNSVRLALQAIGIEPAAPDGSDIHLAAWRRKEPAP